VLPLKKGGVREAYQQYHLSFCRDVDTVDLRRKLPYAVGVLHRLLRRCHRVFVTCTTGLDRAPSCVIGYLHWIQDVSLPQAYEFVTSLHRSGPDRCVGFPLSLSFELIKLWTKKGYRWLKIQKWELLNCLVPFSIAKQTVNVISQFGTRNELAIWRTDFVVTLRFCRPALVWATWDLIAMVEQGKHEGLPTHSVQFVWNHGCNPVSWLYLQSPGQSTTANHRQPRHEMHFFPEFSQNGSCGTGV
jgi:hypothetical protein